MRVRVSTYFDTADSKSGNRLALSDPVLIGAITYCAIMARLQFQNWGCSYNHHSVQSFARGYHDEFPGLAPTGWGSEIRKKRMMIYQICILEIKSKLNIL